MAKYFWRDDLVAAKHLMEDFMRQEHLLPMLVWHVELEHDWKVKPGLYGRGLKKWLRPDLWAELENTYTGMAMADNWLALYNIIALMRKVAGEVGSQMGYPYPEDMHRRTIAYVQKIENRG